MTKQQAINVMSKYTDTDIGIGKPVIQAHSMAIDALKKQIPMQAYFEYDTDFVCPACGEETEAHDVTTIKFCPECGQTLKW